VGGSVCPPEHNQSGLRGEIIKMTRTWAVAGVVLMAMGAVGVQADHHEDIPEILAMTYHVKVLPGHGLEFENA